jgi:hypothetical protein
MPAPKVDTPWMNRDEAAVYCRLAKKTLDNYASHGHGPPFWNPTGAPSGGRVRYHRDALDRWLQGDHSRLGLQPPPGDIIACALSVSVILPPTDPDEAFFEAVDIELGLEWAMADA